MHTPCRTHPWATIALAALLAAAAACSSGLAPRPDRPADLFKVDRRAPRSGIVTAADEINPDAATGSPMLDRLAGVLAELNARDIATLKRAAGAVEDEDAATGELRRVGVLHLKGPASTSRVELGWSDAGDLIARSLDDPEHPPAQLDLRPMGLLMIEWGAPIPSEPPAGELDKWPARVVLTDPVVTQRYVGPGRSRGSAGLPALERVLSDEHFDVRLPAGYDPATPAGVVVWISPRPETWMGQLDALFGPGLDEHGLILVAAANNGNTRPILDRLQVAMDALETVRRAHFVDDERVYVTGMSGGGRSSSILQCSFPEVFTGAIPIVGLNSWHVVRLPDDKYIPSQFAQARRERLALLKTRRICSITGEQDFNAFEMRERTRMFAEDGLDIRLDDYPDMGHDMPTPERFAAALNWVDEPLREARAAGARQAAILLDAYTDSHAPGPPADADARDALVAITRAGPWSEPAWTAARWLGHE